MLNVLVQVLQFISPLFLNI
ncbi:hypothetical protein C5167_017586 [Papaver somniferum]|uniref:Uncharacterized protein n=1 Tax=Papaver somniferum TaxID=3469 RepID=A0A4Y7INU1_PAPSO|nr:hypothetical protein C5167_017586 [Papaver somniferum]